MPEVTTVTLTVPLKLPLALVNAIEAEALRSNTSIPEMLSCMLVDAFEGRETQEFDLAAMDRLASTIDAPPFNTTPPGWSLNNGHLARTENSDSGSRRSNDADDDDDECGGKSPPAPPSP